VRKALAALLFAAAVPVVALATAAPAAASCAGSPTPSAQRFVGKVVDVKDDDTLAVVRREDGATVVVLGAPPAGKGTSSLARTFQENATYEFHPRNEKSPYVDDACTATRLLREGGPEARRTRGVGRLVVVGATVAFALLAAPRLAKWIRRRQRPPGEPHER